MEKKTQGKILFLIVIIYNIILGIFYKFVPVKLNLLLWSIGAVIIIYFINWLNKNTDFFKKTPLKKLPKHRVKVAEELNFISIAIYIGYILSFILIGVGIFSLFLNRPDSFDIFLGAIISSLIVIIIMFIVNRNNKKRQK